MKNASRYIILSLSCVLIGLVCSSLDLFNSFSQVNNVSNTSTVSNGSITSNGSVISNTPMQSNGSETSGGLLPKKPERTGGCGSGFKEIPVELKKVYLEQTKDLKDNGESSKLSYPLRNEVNFYGFTYPFDNRSGLKNDEKECTGKPPKPEGIKFVDPRVNNLIRMYISTVIYNETQAIASKHKIIDSVTVNRIELCLDIECGTNNSKVEKKSFDFVNVADVEYARIYSDTLLSINALDEILSISQSSNENQELVDSEINQLLTVARKVAIGRTNKGN